MKKTSKPRRRETMRPEYDFSKGVRGKYATRFKAGSNIVVLDPDVAKEFGSAEAVNHALRSLLRALPPARRRRVS
jgi:hypothetical protein